MSMTDKTAELAAHDRPGYFKDRPNGAASYALARSATRAGLRLMAYFSLVLILLPAHLAILLLMPSSAGLVPNLFHRVSCRILGLRVHLRGQPTDQRPALIVSNHISYLDVIALGSVLPCRYAAKSDIAAWPVFGWLAKLQRTVFIDRRIARTAHNRDVLGEALSGRDALVLFPEGTSGDGTRVLPFKSSMFDIVTVPERRDRTHVQPVTIAYTGLDGLPIGRALRPLCAWYGDMDLVPHLWTLLSHSSVDIVISFHDSVIAADFTDRKALAAHCRDRVAAGLNRP